MEENYDRLLYPPDGAARDARYTRYVSETRLLRTQTSTIVPGALRELAREAPPDVLLVPGTRAGSRSASAASPIP